MLPRRLGRRHDRTSTAVHRGQSLVEFAFAVPRFLVHLLGTLDLHDGVREGHSHGTGNPSDTTGITSAWQQAPLRRSCRREADRVQTDAVVSSAGAGDVGNGRTTRI